MPQVEGAKDVNLDVYLVAGDRRARSPLIVRHLGSQLWNGVLDPCVSLPAPGSVGESSPRSPRCQASDASQLGGLSAAIGVMPERTVADQPVGATRRWRITRLRRSRPRRPPQGRSAASAVPR